MDESPALHDKETISYEDEFICFGRNLISQALKQKKERGIPTTFLDLAAGKGFAARELQQKGFIEHGLSVGLTDSRDPRDQEYDKKNGLTFLDGNLLQRSTWRKIEEWARDFSTYGGIDVIVCRAVAGYPYSPELSAAGYRALLGRVWQLLTPYDGLFLSDAPYLTPSDHVRSVDYLNNPDNFPGADVYTSVSQSKNRPIMLQKIEVRKSLASNFDLLT
jgi:hypothetical protein